MCRLIVVGSAVLLCVWRCLGLLCMALLAASPKCCADCNFFVVGSDAACVCVCMYVGKVGHNFDASCSGNYTSNLCTSASIAEAFGWCRVNMLLQRLLALCCNAVSTCHSSYGLWSQAYSGCGCGAGWLCPVSTQHHHVCLLSSCSWPHWWG